MKIRINLMVDQEFRDMALFLKKKLGIDSEAAVIRFLIRKAATEEGYKNEEKICDQKNI